MTAFARLLSPAGARCPAACIKDINPLSSGNSSSDFAPATSDIAAMLARSVSPFFSADRSARSNIAAYSAPAATVIATGCAQSYVTIISPSCGGCGVNQFILSNALRNAVRLIRYDPSPDARRIAISAFRGTRSEKGAECLRARAMAEEPDAAVREEMLTVLKSSPHPVAAATLCEAIPFWIKTYAVTDLPEKLPGTQIIEAQNARDHEKSYECVNRAYGNQSGYSCFGKMYVGWWLNELGGKGRVPECPGYPAPK